MTNSIKLTIIGAGSATFSATILRDLCLCRGLHGSNLVLMDISEERHKVMYQYGQRLSDEFGAKLKIITTTDRDTALRDADFVINSAQQGGHDWVEEERAMAEKHGYYRGIYLDYLNQLNLHLSIARDMERLCPNAWLIQIANPVFEGPTLVRRETSIKTFGLCDGGFPCFVQIPRVLGMDPSDFTGVMVGFNHWTWLLDFRYKGMDARPLIDEWIKTKAAEDYWNAPRHHGDFSLSRVAIDQYRRYGVMPHGNAVRNEGWFYQVDLETRKHWYNVESGGMDAEIGYKQYLTELFAKADKIKEQALDNSVPISSTFPNEQSNDQTIPIINLMVNNDKLMTRQVFQVNIANNGLIPEFPDDLNIECQGVVSPAGIYGIQFPRFPRKLLVEAMIPRWHKAELMIEAVRSGNYNSLLAYFLNDHRTRNYEQAEGLAKEWLEHPKNKQMKDLFNYK